MTDEEMDDSPRVRANAAKALSDEVALISEGQRSINRLWERTQSVIAISVVGTTLAVVAALVWNALSSTEQSIEMSRLQIVVAAVILSNLVGTVTGFYFSRTNHQNVGGVKAQDMGR